MSKGKGRSKIKIRRKCGEGISISGPATVWVRRGVTLVVEAPHEARVSRLDRRAAGKK